jgi:hypothetical protein
LETAGNNSVVGSCIKGLLLNNLTVFTAKSAKISQRTRSLGVPCVSFAPFAVKDYRYFCHETEITYIFHILYNVCSTVADDGLLGQPLRFQANSAKLLPLQIVNSPCGVSDDERMKLYI